MVRRSERLGQDGNRVPLQELFVRGAVKPFSSTLTVSGLPLGPVLCIDRDEHGGASRDYFFFFWDLPSGTWDVSSPTRDWTRTHCSGSVGS